MDSPTTEMVCQNHGNLAQSIFKNSYDDKRILELPEALSQFFSKKAKIYQKLANIAKNGQNYPKMPYIDLKMKKIKSNGLLKRIKDASKLVFDGQIRRRKFFLT